MSVRRITRLLPGLGLLVCCAATGASALDQGVAQIRNHPKHGADRPTPRNSRLLTAYTPEVATSTGTPIDAPHHSSLPLVLAGLTVAGASIARRTSKPM